MEKIIKDRINALKSQLSNYTNPKMSKRIFPHVVDDLKSRIDELERLLYRCTILSKQTTNGNTK